jgi:hypothetical protein
VRNAHDRLCGGDLVAILGRSEERNKLFAGEQPDPFGSVIADHLFYRRSSPCDDSGVLLSADGSTNARVKARTLHWKEQPNISTIGVASILVFLQTSSKPKDDFLNDGSFMPASIQRLRHWSTSF